MKKEKMMVWKKMNPDNVFHKKDEVERYVEL